MKIGKSREVPKSRCPACGESHHMACSINGIHKPTPGDITICIDCAHVMAFDNNLLLRNLTKEEEAEIESNLLIKQAKARILLEKLNKLLNKRKP